MHTWNAYFQINGYDFSRFPVIEFPVPDDLYTQIQTALSANRPLRDCPFHAELLRLAHAALDLDAFRPEYADLFPELSDVSVASCTIDDTGDLARLNDHFRGRPLPDLSDPILAENREGTLRHQISIYEDDDGAVEEITVDAEALESESERSSSWAPTYPDYDFVSAHLDKILR